MLWGTCDANKGEVHRVLNSLPSWRARAKGAGTWVVIFEIHGRQWDRPTATQMTDAQVLYSGKHRAHHRPLASGAEHSRVVLTMLTGAPAPNQLCKCGIELEGHRAGGARQRVDDHELASLRPDVPR
eukprot:7724672-Pyramimonas_sp.AAC.1